ncbi:MAG: hypothetical protein ACOX2U_02890 [Limisphaerales bacterium]|jgi:hypothetical protein
MRNRSILDITLAIIGVLAIVFFVPALDFHNLNEKKKIVRIFSDGCVVAEMKILQPGGIQLNFENESLMKGKNDSEIYVCSGGGKLNFSLENKKTTFTLSADRIQVEDIPLQSVLPQK